MFLEIISMYDERHPSFNMTCSKCEGTHCTLELNGEFGEEIQVVITCKECHYSEDVYLRVPR